MSLFPIAFQVCAFVFSKIVTMNIKAGGRGCAEKRKKQKRKGKKEGVKCGWESRVGARRK